MTRTEKGLEELTPFEYFTDKYNVTMKQYIMEYRDKSNKPHLIMVEAEGQKAAIAEARKQIKKGEYLVANPKRCFVEKIK